MRVIVTGASGFLGRAVLASLSASGIDCVGVSRRAGAGLTQVASYRDTPHGDVLVHLAEANDRAWVNAQGADYEAEAVAIFQALLSLRDQQLG